MSYQRTNYKSTRLLMILSI